MTNQTLQNTDLDLAAFGHPGKLLSIALSIAQEQEHAPIVLLLSEDGITQLAGQYHDDATKDRFVEGVQRISASIKAHTSVFIYEGWLTFLPKGSGVPTDEKIAEVRAAKDGRNEALILNIEQRGKSPLMLAAMIGVDGGVGKRKVGGFERILCGMMSGRMSDLLGELQTGELV